MGDKGQAPSAVKQRLRDKKLKEKTPAGQSVVREGDFFGAYDMEAFDDAMKPHPDTIGGVALIERAMGRTYEGNDRLELIRFLQYLDEGKAIGVTKLRLSDDLNKAIAPNVMTKFDVYKLLKKFRKEAEVWLDAMRFQIHSDIYKKVSILLDSITPAQLEGMSIQEKTRMIVAMHKILSGSIEPPSPISMTVNITEPTKERSELVDRIKGKILEKMSGVEEVIKGTGVDLDSIDAADFEELSE